MYKIANDKAQNSARRFQLHEILTAEVSEDGTEGYRENLVLQVRALMQTLEGVRKGTPQRRLIGKQIHDLNERINAIRPKKKAPGVDQYFVDAAREILTGPMFNIVMNRAVALLNEKGVD